MNIQEMHEFFGKAISVYTRAQADLTEWASADKGFIGGFRIPVAVSAAVWADIEKCPPMQDVRGRAHDVLWMASLALRRALRNDDDRAYFEVLLVVGAKRLHRLLVVADGDGVTIGFPEDF